MGILFRPGLVMLFFCVLSLILQTRELATLLFVFLFLCVFYGLNSNASSSWCHGLFYDCGSSWSFICFLVIHLFLHQLAASIAKACKITPVLHPVLHKLAKLHQFYSQYCKGL